ncbi:probable receptor-like protein kinase isoform X1 [Tanacetum coccineum]|uniref:Probable receptor-like protein kinase isoform X1 n=1 Tax=Tanacetum coccineum TaxID=301880 RepID=A0ABQ4YR23_9ASTR
MSSSLVSVEMVVIVICGSKLPIKRKKTRRENVAISIQGYCTQIAAVAVLCVQPEPSYRPLIADVLHSFIPLVPVAWRRFFLAGNSQNDQQQEGQPIRTWGRGQQGESQQKDSNNLFQGFDGEFLAEAFSVDQEIGQTHCRGGKRPQV